jgi:hypothetical protein
MTKTKRHPLVLPHRPHQGREEEEPLLLHPQRQGQPGHGPVLVIKHIKTMINWVNCMTSHIPRNERNMRERKSRCNSDTKTKRIVAWAVRQKCSMQQNKKLHFYFKYKYQSMHLKLQFNPSRGQNYFFSLLYIIKSISLSSEKSIKVFVTLPTLHHPYTLSKNLIDVLVTTS